MFMAMVVVAMQRRKLGKTKGVRMGKEDRCRSGEIERDR